MDQKELYHPYTNDNGRKVGGTAALNHYISQVGGPQGYNDEVLTIGISTLIKKNQISINEDLIKTAKKKLFKKIG